MGKQDKQVVPKSRKCQKDFFVGLKKVKTYFRVIIPYQKFGLFPQTNSMMLDLVESMKEQGFLESFVLQLTLLGYILSEKSRKTHMGPKSL